MSFSTLVSFLPAAIDFPPWIKPEIFAIGPISLKWYGLAYVAGFLLGWWYGTRTCAQTTPWEPNVPAPTKMIVPGKRMLEDYFVWIIIGILLGGRLGSVILYQPEKYLENPLAILKVWEGGMAFHGGLVGVALGVIWMSYSRKIPLRRLGDIVAISVPFGLFFGRLANFINGELWGDVTDKPWGVRFLPEHGAGPLPRHPSQLYEAFLEGVVIFAILYIAVHKFKALTRPGLCTGLFLVLYGIFRMLVEIVRVPDVGIDQFGIFTRGQAYSIPMVLLGLFFIAWAFRKAPVGPLRVPDTAKIYKGPAA